MKPKALDLFCGGGGISVGLARAGFDVTGVDLNPKCEKYWRLGMEPHGGEFICADALTFPLDGFDLVCASPPCQGYSSLRHTTGRTYPMLIEPTRDRLTAWQTGKARSRFGGLPRLWIIENVEGAPLRHGFTLCGSAFGLGAVGPDGTYRPLRRHRLFEPSWGILAPACQCDGREVLGVYGSSDGGKKHRCGGRRGGYQGTMPEKRAAMQIDWMPRAMLNEAIPPCYGQFIGQQALAVLRSR